MDDLQDRVSERRQITVLFCDIVDSTGLSERCDAEDLREILLEFQTVSTRCIKDAGGNVINYIGDGIRSEFGYPLNSENEAEHAVRAGLDILRAIDELGPRAVATLREPLRIRIGVHTGIAVIGKAALGHVHDATEIVGETPNIAFRLQELGKPNSIVISAETSRLVKDRFKLRPLGQVALKGLSRKVSAYEVAGEVGYGHISPRSDRRSVAPIVGRNAELAQLLDAWGRVQARRGEAIEIVGEAGIGKSRLAGELIEQTGLRPEEILTLQASAQHQHTPFYPIIRSFEHRIGIRNDGEPENNRACLRQFLAQMGLDEEEPLALVSELLGLSTGQTSATSNPDRQELRRKTRDVVVRMMTSSANSGSRLLLFEDLHWLDPSSLEVLQRLVKEIESTPLLLVMNSRTVTLADRSPSIRKITLRRLANEECAQLAASVARSEALSKALLDRIIARSDGVPLFVEELATAAVETGQLESAPARVGATSAAAEIPSALYDPLMLRLERLGDAKSVAQLASVIGRTFSHRLLELVAVEQGTSPESALKRLLDSGLVQLDRNDDERTYSFKHALVRDVAYHSLLRRQRRELHACVADMIETYLPEITDREPDCLAQHLAEAGRPLRAVQMWLRAAKKSAEQSANLEALAQLGMALSQIEALDTGYERDNLELEAHIASIAPNIALHGFAAEEVSRVSDRAIELCQRLGEDTRIFPALYARWSYLRVDGKMDQASAQAQRFLQLADRKGSRADRMVGHRLVGTSLIESEAERGHAHLTKAVRLYDAAKDQALSVVYGTDVQVASLSNLCIADWLLGRVSEALAHGRSALELAARIRHAHTLGYAFSHVCMLHTLERDVATVEFLANQALEGATRRELPLWVSVARTFLGWAVIESGRTAEGIEALEQQRNFLRTAHLLYWLPTYLCWLAEAYIDADRPNDAGPCLQEARQILHGGKFWYEPECLRLEARLNAHPRLGDAKRAVAGFGAALDLARQRGQRGFALRAALSFAAHLKAAGNAARAFEILQEELHFFADQPQRGDRAEAQALIKTLSCARSS
jgi:class 3 adenylate cyclase/tetratricopeptide (TPR) repeat protein